MEPMEWTVGVHELKFEPPDICHCHINGPVALDEAKLALELMEKEIVSRVGNNFYLVVHLPLESKGTSQETRKYISSVKPKWKAGVVVGGTAFSRMLVNMVVRTANLLAGTSTPLRMVRRAEEAYALINDWRTGKKPSG